MIVLGDKELKSLTNSEKVQIKRCDRMFKFRTRVIDDITEIELGSSRR